jgi:hypothetical protein
VAGKAAILATRRLHYALDKLSKNALIDLVVDRARADIGEDADDEALAETIQRWINPVLTIRQDHLVGLTGAMCALDALDDNNEAAALI